MNFRAISIGVLLLFSFKAQASEINVPKLVNRIHSQRYPAFAVKRSVELVATKAWRGLVSMAHFDTIPEKYKMSAVFVKLALDALDRKENLLDPDVQRVRRLTDQLNPVSLDPKMRGCFHVYYIEDKNFDNAFTTTCNIFVTRSLPEKLNDNQLRAVIAHEMGHGILGHFPETYQKLLGELGTNLMRLPIEEAFWLVHGQFHGYMGYIHETYYDAYVDGRQKFYNSTTFRPTEWQDKFFQWFDATSAGVSSGFDAIMNHSLEVYGTGQDIVELQADVAATILLHKLGRSGKDLISALMTLENIKSESELRPLPSSNVHTPRQYPSLYYRIKAIRAADRLR